MPPQSPSLACETSEHALAPSLGKESCVYTFMSIYLLKQVWVLPGMATDSAHTQQLLVWLCSLCAWQEEIFSIFLSHFMFLSGEGKFSITDVG